MSLADMLLAEVDLETDRTRRLLERVPAGKSDWKPHDRSMSLGQLAGHVAELPWFGQTILETDELDVTKPMGYERFVATDGAAAVERFRRTMEGLRGAARGTTDERMLQPWTFRRGDTVIFSAPRLGAVRDFVLTHSAHHRGQLTVYLRLLDVPLPGLFGPSADEPRM